MFIPGVPFRAFPLKGLGGSLAAPFSEVYLCGFVSRYLGYGWWSGKSGGSGAVVVPQAMAQGLIVAVVLEDVLL